MKITDKTIIKDPGYNTIDKYPWINDDDIEDTSDALNGDEISIAVIEITNGVKWEDSKITPKTEAKKISWDELKEEIENVAGIVDLPQEFI